MRLKSRPWEGENPISRTLMGKATTPPPKGVEPAIMEPKIMATLKG
eukprot:CAMPEP_0113650634 /NCGR_PEP_ID=MMETSP0017_2-20120614/26958_1 /TAXON_ID=2856 /ORGANISM="Cylindrotheca closterium" /LENGTH=45 /DNA_ID=CAMNT_0000563189 /DNA_START=89 /DNA_END=226 /DNA_ORIENTATION=+ /assembly_acc=CAM_ASM_000147